MEKLTLKVDTGAVTVDVENENGKKIGEFEFVPTDTDIVNRYGSVVEFFNNVSFNENERNEEIVKKFSSQIREQFDHLFNYPVSDSMVLVYKCRQKKLNSLYYKKKEQRRCSTWRKIKNRILRNSSSRSSISTMPEVPHILNWNMNMA